MNKWILAAVLAATTSLFHGCSGAQGSPPTWIVVVDIGLQDAQLAVNAAQSLVVGATQLTPQQRQDAVTALRTASDGIGLAETLLNAFSRVQDLPTKCRINAVLHDVAMGLAGAITVLTDAGVRVPLWIPQAIGGAASFADIFFPGCADGGTATTAQQVRMRLERRAQ